jgi:hypothetical protein
MTGSPHPKAMGFAPQERWSIDGDFGERRATFSKFGGGMAYFR